MLLILKIHKVWFCSLHKTTRHYSNSFLLHYVPDSLKYRKLTFFSNCSKVDGQLNEQESINKQIPCNMIWEKCHFRNIVVIYILSFILSVLHNEWLKYNYNNIIRLLWMKYYHFQNRIAFYKM